MYAFNLTYIGPWTGLTFCEPWRLKQRDDGRPTVCRASLGNRILDSKHPSVIMWLISHLQPEHLFLLFCWELRCRPGCRTLPSAWLAPPSCTRSPSRTYVPHSIHLSILHSGAVTHTCLLPFFICTCFAVSQMAASSQDVANRVSRLHYDIQPNLRAQSSVRCIPGRSTTPIFHRITTHTPFITPLCIYPSSRFSSSWSTVWPSSFPF